MSFKSPLLNKINEPKEAPLNSYILYNLNGGIFWIDVKKYPDFVSQWIGTYEPPPLTMDLSSAGIHSLILDFDFKKNTDTTPKVLLEIIESILKITLIPNVLHFTYLIAVRAGGKGIHIHLPEFKIGHDDYILFCENFKTNFRQAMEKDECYELDILANAMLSGAAKPDCQPYRPVQLVYVDEKNRYCINTVQVVTSEIENVRKKFVKKKDNEKSLFRTILNTSPRMWSNQFKQYMMPIVIKNPQPIYVLSYVTAVRTQCNKSPEWEDVAVFTYKRTNDQGFISKCKNLTFNNFNLLKSFNYLKLNSRNMIAFETNNHAMKMWFKRLSSENVINLTHIPEMFLDVHEILQLEHAILTNDPNPIKTIMQFNGGYYFLPAFFSLCQHCDTNSLAVAQKLYPLLDDAFHPLLNKIQIINPEIMKCNMAGISINTLHFCANNLSVHQSERLRDRLKFIIDNNKRTILSVTTVDQMMNLVRNIQDRHLPILVLKLKNDLNKANRYIWNPIHESWQEVQSKEVGDHLKNLWNYIVQFLNEHHASGGSSGIDMESIKCFPINTVVSAIMSDTSMERKNIQMDNHKWLLRLEDGVLDLLTGHIGGVVPEFFLSDRKINIEIRRKEMMELCSESLKHEKLYEKLTSEKFFYYYLQNLFMDKADNLFDTLCYVLQGDDDKLDDIAKSMLHFYVNLCKCICFEHDMLLYMLDILSSIYVGTNYERKFFVFKGLTRNGKSKLFELMSRILGGYYHSIQPENLLPGNSGNNATPELASTLFSCRMVTTEEMEKKVNENRVKQITGDSFVTFRNLYEQNSGGIPTAKLFATTNYTPEVKASKAFKDRVVAIPFDAEFTHVAPKSTSLQVTENTYFKEPYVVDQSYKGGFFFLYYHLKKYINLSDGLLKYRSEPEYIAEFTVDYLIRTDIYVQFKIHMDVQIVPKSFTTINELISAIRQYLKNTKNTSYDETDIRRCFEKEFGHLRKSDISMESTNDFSYSSVLDAEPSAKKAKMETKSSMVVFFENIAIKNLRKTTLDI